MKKTIFVLLVLIISIKAFGSHAHHHTGLKFEKNLGQWNTSAKYRLNVKGGKVYISNKSLVFDLYSLQDVHTISKKMHLTKNLIDFNNQDNFVRAHSYQVNFKGANNNVQYKGIDKFEEYKNYILGSDKSKWKSNIPLYHELIGDNLYSKIDIKMYSKEENYKYDFIVHPGANINDIKMEYTGVDNITLVNGDLKLQLSFENKESFCHELSPWFVMGFQRITTSFIYQAIKSFSGLMGR